MKKKVCNHDFELIHQKPFYRLKCKLCNTFTGWFDSAEACQRAVERNWLYVANTKIF